MMSLTPGPTPSPSQLNIDRVKVKDAYCISLQNSPSIIIKCGFTMSYYFPAFKVNQLMNLILIVTQ